MVVFGHAFVLLGKPVPLPELFGIPVDRLGVYVFFVISGYLITKSWLRRPNWLPYLAARSLRIFPGLAVVVVLSVLVLGPVFTSLPLGSYFSDPATWRYGWNIPLRIQYTLPGVFDALPYGGVVNGSLWTLPVEFACYLIVPLVLWLPGRFRVLGAVAFAAVSIALDTWLTVQVPVWGFTLNDAAHPWIFFAMGMIVALVVQRRFLRLDAALLGVFALLFVQSVSAAAGTVLAWFVVPYAVLCVGLASTPYLRRASRFGDISYGLYIYAFPVQQMVIAVFGVHSLGWNLVAVVLATVAVSFVSWHVVESPMLMVKVAFERRFTARRERRPEPSPLVVRGTLRD